MTNAGVPRVEIVAVGDELVHGRTVDTNSSWLATELDEDGDTLFGLADLGDPELGSFSLAEMQALELPLGMGIERDILFAGDYPLSLYAQAARTAGRIVIDERSLRAAAAALKREG